ncbi:N(2)-acetyl-L-2,4-diaminobutanoate deacetylase DoeB2 [Dasania marina]|uniref:N(2)-acetyl-L-2,4-diaminobutanoate deacetylase DoeB2 n=1 Tax=Dasania marina TaxID=471499 RepID=UPI000370CA87|nr:N(2)-acetyl-L-2,4-diaminobutanoate deacetylase DoeB2 [Dasania marina]
MSSSWDSIIQQAVAFRHVLHRNPELAWNEINTAANIRQRLDQLKITWRACAEHGTVATIAAHASGKHIALRGDMDALPIQEQATNNYCSNVSGIMHACGHDGHTAVLWATAAWLKAHESELPGPVSFIFQPAEEGGHGAREMINAGALKGIEEIFGWHNWPAIPFGHAVCPDGAVMSGNGTFLIVLHGAGGHASQPELCRDPVLAASAVVLNLQQIISRRMAPQDAAVVSVTSIEAPSGPTVIPNMARLGGSIRLAKPELREKLNALITEITTSTALAYGVTAEVQVEDRYQATINHSKPAQRFRNVLADIYGPEWQSASTVVPIMASEDFSYYLQHIPGAFALIGMSSQEAYSHPCHSPHYEFNDALISPVVRTLAALAGAPNAACIDN